MSVAEILHKPETLRKMLDEHGVEHYDRFDVTEWVGSDGEICHTSVNYSNGATVLVLRKCTTPEQAIEATLGPLTEKVTEQAVKDTDAGTCHMEPVKNYHVAKYVTSWGCVCSNCKTFHEFTHGETWKYCPTCRAEVIDA